MRGLVQRRGTGHVRGGHRGAVVAGVARHDVALGAHRHRRPDARTRRTDVDRGLAPLREARQGAGAGDRSHRDDVGVRVVRRIAGRRVVVVGIVAGRGDEQDVGVVGAADRVLQALREATAAPRVVGGDDVQAMAGLQVGDVVHRLDRVGGGAAATAQELGADQLDAAPAHAGHALAVAAGAGDRARHVRAVVVVGATGVDVVAATVEVPAAGVVDIAVAVVVDAVGRIVRIAPDVGGEVFVVVVDAFVDDADDDIAAVGVAGAPGLGGLRAVLVGRRRRIAVHAPQRTVGGVGVVGGGAVLVGPVRFGVFDGRVAAQRADGRG